MPPTLHPTLSPERVESLAHEAFWQPDPPGVCIACGTEVRGIDPERERATCPSCGQRAVSGAQRLVFLMMGVEP